MLLGHSVILTLVLEQIGSLYAIFEAWIVYIDQKEPWTVLDYLQYERVS